MHAIAPPPRQFSRLAALAAEIGYRQVDADLFVGPCPDPACQGDTLLWAHRQGRPSYSYLCLQCGHQGAMFGLLYRSRTSRRRDGSQVAA